MRSASIAGARQPEAVVERLKRQLGRWRKRRRRGERMPERLWEAAREVAQQLGLAPASRLLKLDYYNLKRRLEERAVSEPTFIELGRVGGMAGATGPAAKWCIELSGLHGRKVRVEYQGPQAPELGLLGRSLWGADE